MLRSVKAYIRSKQVLNNGKYRDSKETAIAMNEIVSNKKSLLRLKCLKSV
jgi:hypothetical protein